MDGNPGTAQSSATEPTVDIREEAAADARAVADTAKHESRTAMADIKQEFHHQVSDQKSRLADSIRTFGDELDNASQNSTGTVSDLASDAAERARRISGWVEEHEPADAVHSLEDFARRRPIWFLLGAAAAGAVIGRITRNAMAGRGRSDPETITGPGVRASDTEHLAVGQEFGTGAVPATAGPSGQAMQPHMTGEPADEARLTAQSGPLSQRGYDAQSEYPSNDQPVTEVGDELPAPGTRIGQGPRREGGRR